MTRTLPAALVLAGTAAAVPLAVTLTGPLSAQGLDDSLLSATISQRFEVDDNFNLDRDSRGTSYFADTRLALALLQEGPTQRFRFGLDTGLRALWEVEEDFEFRLADPSTASAGYSQDWASGSFGGDLRFRTRRVDFLDDITFTEITIDDDIVVLVPDDLDRREVDTTERRFDGAFALALATDSPSSYRLGLRATRIEYSDNAADLTERDDIRADIGWTLRLNPVLSATLTGGYAYLDSKDAVDDTIEVREIDAGLAYDVSEILRVNASIGFADRERRQTLTENGERVRRTVEDDSGLVVRAGLNYQVADDVSVAANVRISDATPDDTRTSGDLRASYALPRGSLDARLSQDYTFSSGGDDSRITRAGLGFTHAIDSVSSVRFDASYGLQVDQDADRPDITRVDFSAVYSRDILDDVFANVGYRFRYRDEDGSANSNAVFFSIGRSFATRF
jgi:hypothetical protein